MPAVRGDGMRGLAVFISDIRFHLTLDDPLEKLNFERIILSNILAQKLQEQGGGSEEDQQGVGQHKVQVQGQKNSWYKDVRK